MGGRQGPTPAAAAARRRYTACRARATGAVPAGNCCLCVCALHSAEGVTNTHKLLRIICPTDKLGPRADARAGRAAYGLRGGVAGVLGAVPPERGARGRVRPG